MQFTDPVQARLWLMRNTTPPAPRLVDFVAREGVVEAVARLRSGTTGSVPDDVIGEVDSRVADISDDLHMLESETARLLSPESSGWPRGTLADLDRHGLGSPVGLWVRGNPDLLARPDPVAIVGARAATAYGEHVTHELAYALAQAGRSVVCGGNFGIEAAALRAALSADGGPPPIVVLSHGVDRVYPSAHANLFRQVLDRGGALVSEHPPGTLASLAHTVARGRILAALATTTIVVEAARRSGALSVAGVARTLGRQILGIPGPITSGQSRGVHELLADGTAQLICDPDALPDLLADEGDHRP